MCEWQLVQVTILIYCILIQPIILEITLQILYESWHSVVYVIITKYWLNQYHIIATFMFSPIAIDVILICILPSGGKFRNIHSKFMN